MISKRFSVVLGIFFCALMCSACSLLSDSKEDKEDSSDPSWESVGDPIIPYTDWAPLTALCLNGDTPYVFYQDSTNASRGSVSRFDGDNWVALGNAGFTEIGETISDLNLKFDSAGIPYVAYKYGSAVAHFSVMKLNGTTWEKVGDAEISTEVANSLNLAINPDNEPVVAYLALNTGTARWFARVRKYSSSAWSNIGGPIEASGTQMFRSLQLSFTGAVPVLAFQDNNTPINAWVWSWTASNGWVTVGNGITTASNAALTLAIDSTGVPSLAYSTITPVSAHVYTYGGIVGATSTWNEIGQESLDSESVTYPMIALDESNNPWIGYIDPSDHRLSVKKFDESTWEEVGSKISDGSASSSGLKISSTGVPYVVFSGEQDEEGKGVHVYRYR